MQRKSWSSPSCKQLHFIPTCFLTEVSGTLCEHTWDTHKGRGDKYDLIQGRRFLTHILCWGESIQRKILLTKSESLLLPWALILRAFALCHLSVITSLLWAKKCVATFNEPVWVQARWEEQGWNPPTPRLSFPVHSHWYYAETLGNQQRLPTPL